MTSILAVTQAVCKRFIGKLRKKHEKSNESDFCVAILKVLFRFEYTVSFED